MRFPFMPVEEEAWVREVRGDHKEGRRSARGRVNPPRIQGTQHASGHASELVSGQASEHASEKASGTASGLASERSSGQASLRVRTEESRRQRRPSTDTPHQIAAKRALRAAKKAAAALLLTTAATPPWDSQVLRVPRELSELSE